MVPTMIVAMCGHLENTLKFIKDHRESLMVCKIRDKQVWHFVKSCHLCVDKMQAAINTVLIWKVEYHFEEKYMLYHTGYDNINAIIVFL